MPESTAISIVTNVGGATTTKVRVLAGQSYSVKQQVIRIDYENNSEFSDETRNELIENLAIASADAHAIVVSDYGYGVVDKALFERARQLADQYSIPLIVDSRTSASRVQRCDVSHA